MARRAKGLLSRVDWRALEAEATAQGLGAETDTTVTHYGRAPLIACGFSGAAPATMAKEAVTCPECLAGIAARRR